MSFTAGAAMLNETHAVATATIIPLQDLAGALQIASDAGAKRILIPVADMMQYSKVPADLISKFSLEVYSDPVDAAFKALGIK